MRKSRFSEAQIIEILKHADAGMKVVDICRQHGVPRPVFWTQVCVKPPVANPRHSANPAELGGGF